VGRQPGQVIRDRIARTGQVGQDNRGKTAETDESEQVNLNRMART
jgi:hypothetical protein